MTSTTSDSAGVKSLLWVDDQIAAFGSHIEDLEENGYSVTQAATVEEALSTIHSGARFDVVLVDLKMLESDGIQLLARLGSGPPDLEGTKIVVLSSFLYETKIRKRLVDLNMNVALLEKTGKPGKGQAASLAERLEAILSREDVAPPPSDQFSRWDREASSTDPFEISLRSYLDSPMVVRSQLDHKAEVATRQAREELAERSVVWSLFCGSSEKPEMTASDMSDIPPDEQIFTLASRLDRPPYEFFERGEFEEHTGHGQAPNAAIGDLRGCPGSPDYPFFKIRVVHQRENNISINLSRDFHFDSGLDVTAFALTTALQIGLDVDKTRPAKFVRYGGKQHAFYPATGDAFVERGNRGTLSVAIAGRAYLNWDETPFSRQCKDFDCSAGALCARRYALLGRNILVENELQLDLRGIGT
ncbi:MAG TPA: response regulator [Solirubrobacterales bacterium]|nr:response regulator [Solirubrobacterales bacterium]